jgi:hypothetical protein
VTRAGLTPFASTPFALTLSCAVLVLACAACGGSGGSAKTLQPKDLSKLVLATSDLHAPYTVIENAHGAGFEVPPGRASRARTDGWIARFRADGNAHVPLLVQSRIDVYPSVADAQKQLADYATSFAKTSGNGGGPTAVPAIADGAQAFAVDQGIAPNVSHFFGIAWRHQNLVADVQTEGVGRAATLAGIVALARAQDRRIAAAAG